MNQVRFSIGVPKAGSAAREAEHAAKSPLRSIVPRAGSAARDAEARNKLEATHLQRSASISMRASGGRVVEPVAQVHPSTGKADTGVELSAAGSGLPLSIASNRNGPVVAAAPSGFSVPDGSSSGSLHTAAGHLKSLVRSLFFPGASSNES